MCCSFLHASLVGLGLIRKAATAKLDIYNTSELMYEPLLGGGSNLAHIFENGIK